MALPRAHEVPAVLQARVFGTGWSGPVAISRIGIRDGKQSARPARRSTASLIPLIPSARLLTEVEPTSMESVESHELTFLPRDISRPVRG